LSIRSENLRAQYPAFSAIGRLRCRWRWNIRERDQPSVVLRAGCGVARDVHVGAIVLHQQIIANHPQPRCLRNVSGLAGLLAVGHIANAQRLYILELRHNGLPVGGWGRWTELPVGEAALVKEKVGGGHQLPVCPRMLAELVTDVDLHGRGVGLLVHMLIGVTFPRQNVGAEGGSSELPVYCCTQLLFGS